MHFLNFLRIKLIFQTNGAGAASPNEGNDVKPKLEETDNSELDILKSKPRFTANDH